MTRQTKARLSFLLLLFTGTLCNAMIVPFMAFFLVEGLGHAPWVISVYSVLGVGLTLTVNRTFGRRIDQGARVFPLVGLAAGGFLVASLALFVAPSLGTALTFGVAGFGLSASAVSTMFSLGGSIAEHHGLARSNFNAHMRATTSTGWMVGPALAFLLADVAGYRMVFAVAAGICLLWTLLWWVTLPRSISAGAKPVQDAGRGQGTSALWLAGAFIFCLSLAHSLTFSSLPLFFVREVGLPGYAPGLAFSVKTFVEVVAIFSTPFLIARVGMFRALLATSLLAVATIQFLASVQSFPQMLLGAGLEGLYYGLYASLGISYVQSFAKDRPASATALYWNILMVTGVLAGPAVGVIANAYDFRLVVQLASVVAFISVCVLVAGRLKRPA